MKMEQKIIPVTRPLDFALVRMVTLMISVIIAQMNTLGILNVQVKYSKVHTTIN